MSAPASERFDRLRRRLSCFMGDRRAGRRSVGLLVRQLGEHGEVAIVGGMLRDLLLKESYRAFTSDVDLVVDSHDTEAVHRILQAHGAVGNRFGGYALGTEWQTDVWLLNRTWARVQGHRTVSKVEDLLETTFFNWDAVLYSVTRKQVICGDDYLASLDDRLLDVNLEINPNPVGSCVRALRSAVSWGAVVTPRLASFVLRIREEAGAETLLSAERRSFGHRRVLSEQILDEATRFFTQAARSNMPSKPLPSAARFLQRELPLSGGAMRTNGADGVAAL